MNALEELIELSKEPYNSAVKDWKAKGGKVIGLVCTYVPEEFIHAAGLLPHRISPTGCTETTQADGYLSRLNCTFCRACLQLALEGKFDFLDGLVAVNPCDHIRRLWDLWKIKVGLPFTHMLSLPHRISEGAVQWYKEELELFREGLEKAFETEISDANLADAIKEYNTTRGLLKRIYQLREREAPPLKGNEALSIVVATLHTPKTKCNKLLEELLSELEERKGVADHKARLMVVGGACDDPGFIKVIEDAGGLVVTDALCFGSRYFWEPVATNGDPILALASAYLHKPFCAGMSGGERQRLNFIMEMGKRFKIDGIIFQKIRWCDLWGGEAFYVGERLKELGIPLLTLEREYWLSGVEQLKTRVQAFLEVVGR